MLVAWQPHWVPVVFTRLERYPVLPLATKPNCCPRVLGTRTVLPCQFDRVQQLLHCAFETPMRHWPATSGLELVKYEIDQ